MMGAGPDCQPFVEISSDALDKIFHQKLSGSTLDSTMIVHGVEAAQALCKTILPAGSEPQGSSHDESKPKSARALVTFQDAEGWEFEAELRTTPQLQEHLSSKHVLCGMIIFGEKRPPSANFDSEESPGEIVADAGDSDRQNIPDVAFSSEEMGGVPHSDPQNARVGVTKGDLRNLQASLSLQSIPEDKESVQSSSQMSSSMTLGWKVDAMLLVIRGLQMKAKQDRHAYKSLSQIKRFFTQSIMELVIQTEQQILCIPSQSSEVADADISAPPAEVQASTVDPPNPAEPSPSSQVRLRCSATIIE